MQKEQQPASKEDPGNLLLCVPRGEQEQEGEHMGGADPPTTLPQI